MSNPNIVNLNNLDGRYATPSLVDGKIAAQATTDAEQYLSSSDVSRINSLAVSQFKTPPPVLDLNYASTMALAGFETFTRSTTDSYVDALGNTQSVAINTAAFDRQTRLGTTYKVPFGLKLSSAGSAIVNFNPSNILSSSFTIAIDIDAGSSITGNTTIFSLNGGSVTNRVEAGISAQNTVNFVVQTGGVVVANQTLGSTSNTFYGGPRRLVISVTNNSFIYSDDGQYWGQSSSGSAPSSSNLTNFNIGGTIPQTKYFNGWIKRVRIYQSAFSSSQVVNLAAGDTPVACWGDSLTAGTGATGPAAYWPELLRLSRYPHSSVYNGGVGGETSTQIKTRMLADTIRNSWTTVFWVGRNNFSSAATVLSDIASMVNNLTHKRYVILGVTNAGDGTEDAGSTNYLQIVALNQQLASLYPNNFIDIRSLLVAASSGTNDTIASSYRSDGVHLNNTGYNFVASQISTFMNTKRWL